MFKHLLAALIVLSCASFAAAQGSSDKDWTGFYAGGNVFASGDKSDAAANLQINQVTNLNVNGIIIVVPGTTRAFAASRRETNWGGGFQTGYQWQGGRFVFGPEADFNPFRRTVTVSQSFQLPPTLITQPTTVVASRGIRVSDEFSLRARAGAAFGRTLIYGTGGYAQARVRASVNDSFTNPGGATLTTPPVNLGPSGPVVTAGSERQNMGGWTVGGGFDHKVGRRFSVGFEYRHTDYRSKTFTFPNGTVVNTGPEARGTNGVAGLSGSVTTGPTSVSLKSDTFSVRFNVHF